MGHNNLGPEVSRTNGQERGIKKHKFVHQQRAQGASQTSHDDMPVTATCITAIMQVTSFKAAPIAPELSKVQDIRGPITFQGSRI